MSGRSSAQVAMGSSPGWSPLRSGLMKRQCACGEHTTAGGECHDCNKQRTELQRHRTASIDATLIQHGTGNTTRAGRPRSTGKAEAALNLSVPDDDKQKIEEGAGTGALIGLGVGGAAGALTGGLAGGGLGALVGLGVGGLVGAGIGALIGALGGSGIRWGSANYSADNSPGSSTTVERPFNVRYKAVADKAKKLWRLVVDSIEGTVDINVHTGGSRDPFVQPPTTEAEAKTAVTDMKGYYARGSRGAWHTEAASRAHEEHHYREWKCASEHYWPRAKTSIESVTAPLDAQPNEASAITAMRAGPAGADSKIKSFHDTAHDYWFTLSDSAGARPYAAGQRVLNGAIRHVQDLAQNKKWTVAQGTDNPSPEPPCYQPFVA